MPAGTIYPDYHLYFFLIGTELARYKEVGQRARVAVREQEQLLFGYQLKYGLFQVYFEDKISIYQGGGGGEYSIF